MTSPDSVAAGPADEDPQAVAERSAAAMAAGDRALATLGITVDPVAPERASAHLTVTEAMVNGHGLAHGGFVFALADTAFAYACNTDGRPTVARQCEISFLRPARAGDVLTATAELRAKARRSGIYDVRVTRQDGVAVAELRGHSATLTPTGA